MKAKDIALNALAFLGLAIIISFGQKIIFKLYELYQHVIHGREEFFVDFYTGTEIQNVLIMALIVYFGCLILKKMK